jgi:hypothetical protein
LEALKTSNPHRYEAELKGLFAAWVRETWRRARDLTLPPAGDLVAVAEQYGLGTEVAREVIKAVDCELGGPRFASRSVRLLRAETHPDAHQRVIERFTL